MHEVPALRIICRKTPRSQAVSILCRWLILTCIAITVPAIADPYYALDPAQLERYAKARDAMHSHEDALDYATKPPPENVEDLTPEQREDYDNVTDNGLSHEEAMDYVDQPVAEGATEEDERRSNLELALDAKAHEQAAEEARERAATLLAESGEGEICEIQEITTVALFRSWRTLLTNVMQGVEGSEDAINSFVNALTPAQLTELQTLEQAYAEASAQSPNSEKRPVGLLRPRSSSTLPHLLNAAYRRNYLVKHVLAQNSTTLCCLSYARKLLKRNAIRSMQTQTGPHSLRI